MLHLNPPETGEPTRAASCALHRVGIVKWRLRKMCCGELDRKCDKKPEFAGYLPEAIIPRDFV